MKKRVISMLLAVILCLSLLPVGVLADDKAESMLLTAGSISSDETIIEEIEIAISDDDNITVLTDEEENSVEAQSGDEQVFAETGTDTVELGDEVSFEDVVTDVVEESISEEQDLIDTLSVVDSLEASTEDQIITYEDELLLDDGEFDLWLDGASIISSPSGSSFTSDSALAAKLDNVFNGKVALFSNSTSKFKVGEQLGDPSAGYLVAGKITGWQCFIYANGVYYYLFGDIPYHGSGYSGCWNSSKTVLENTATASYSNFTSAGVSCGAYLRTTPNSDGSYSGSYGHSIIILKYDSSNIWFLNANRDGKNTINVEKMTWSEFNSGLLSGRGRVISHVCTPKTTKPEPPTIKSWSSAWQDTTYQLVDITINWYAVDGATSYQVKWRKAGGSYDDNEPITVSSGTSYTRTGLDPDSNYYFRVFAVNSAGTSSRSETISCLKRPTISSWVANSSSSVTISWGAVTDAVSYTVRRKLSTENDYTEIKSGINGTEFKDTTVQAGTTYHYQVRAVNNEGMSRYSSRCGVTTLTVLTMKYNTNGGTITSDTYSAASSGLIQKGSETMTVKWDYGYSAEAGLYNAKTFGLTRTGYTFKGWSTSKDGSTTVFDQNDATVKAEQIYTNLKNENKTVTLYAIWTPITYTVAYNANGGSSAPENQTKTHGTALTLTTDEPNRSGYTFLGWATSSTATSAQYKPGASYTTEGNATLYAAWEANRYLFSLDANGGNGSMVGFTTIFGESFNIPVNTFSRDGYVFAGWNVKRDADDKWYVEGQGWLSESDIAANSYEKRLYADGEKKTINNSWVSGYRGISSYTFYAIWTEEITYGVTYNANGGTGAPASQTKTRGGVLELSATEPTRIGYTFLGWATGGPDMEIEYQPGDSYTEDSDVTLYAVWQEDEAPVVTGAKLIVSEAKAAPGGEVTLSVSTVGNPGIAALRFVVDYDKTVLALTGYEADGLTGWTVDLTSGTALWDSDKNDTTNGGVLKLIFKAADGAGEGKTAVTLKSVAAGNIDEQPVVVEVTAGGVRITSRIPGDVNGDEEVDIFDLIRLRKFLAGMDVTMDEVAADVNGDGEVDIFDLIRLRKFLAGMDVVLQ